MTDIFEAEHWSKVDPADWPWSNFSPREIASKGDGSIKISRHAMDALQALRGRLGVPLILTSAYRDPAHNKRVGGAARSQHMLGKAFDVRVDNVTPADLIAAARLEGFTSFGTYPRQGFVHIDTRDTPASWGDPFPKSATGYAVEASPPMPKERPSVLKTKTARGLGAAAIPTIGGAINAALSADWLTLAVFGVILLGLVLLLRNRNIDFAAGWT
jgi:hypothetical protein